MTQFPAARLGASRRNLDDSQAVEPRRSLSYPDLRAGEGGVEQETVQLGCCSCGRSGWPIAGGLGDTFLAVRLFVNSFSGIDEPSLGVTTAGIAAAQITAAASDPFITHQGVVTSFTFSGSGHVPATTDEIRWGDRFADVTPAPEAAMSLLAGAALATLLGLRRRSATRGAGSGRLEVG